MRRPRVERDASDIVEERISDQKAVQLFWRVGLTVAVVWAVMGAIAFSMWGSDELGSVGDAMNLVGVLFNGAALAAVAVSVYLQRGDLQETRREMRRTQAELRFSQKLQAEQIEVDKDAQELRWDQLEAERVAMYVQTVAAQIQARVGDRQIGGNTLGIEAKKAISLALVQLDEIQKGLHQQITRPQAPAAEADA